MAAAILQLHSSGQNRKIEYKEEVYGWIYGNGHKTYRYLSQVNTQQIIYITEKSLNNHVHKRLIQWISAHVPSQLPQYLYNMLMEKGYTSYT